jgi:hypothetical protein
MLALAAPAGAAPSVGPWLVEALAGEVPEEGLRVIVTLRRHDLPGPRRLRRQRMRERIDAVSRPLRGGRFQARRRYSQLGGFAGTLDRAAIQALSRHPLVEAIYLDRKVMLTLAQGTALVGAAELQTYGVTGAGVNVAVVDSGVDFTHPDLAGALVDEHCICDNGGGCCPLGGTEETQPGSAADGVGHGTQVAGIIASRGMVSSAPGVAPEAGIIAVRVFASNGQSNFSDIAAGLEWLHDNRVSLGLDAVNMSIGDGVPHNNSNSTLCNLSATARAIGDLHSRGIPVFVSTGNEGFDNGVAFPSCVSEAIAVGGVYDQAVGTVGWCSPSGCGTTLCTDTNTAADDFVCHTNAGNPLDMLAPEWRTNTTKKGGGTINFGGTSASAPYAAGMAALLIEADSTLDADDITSLMTGFGPDITDPTTSQSYPRTDVQAALLSVATVDADLDGVSDDGDGSGAFGDAPCTGGATASCDDNCPFDMNAGQEDSNWDGIGDVCQPDDADGDGIPETGAAGLERCTGEPLDETSPACLDNCPGISNPDQTDSDGDYFGNGCDMDLNGDGTVGGPDYVAFGATFGTSEGDPGWNAEADGNGDKTVGGPDFVIFGQRFGFCQGATSPGVPPEGCPAVAP